VPTRPATLQREISTNPFCSLNYRNNVTKIVKAMTESDGFSVQGTSRKQNEDRYLVQVRLSRSFFSFLGRTVTAICCESWPKST